MLDLIALAVAHNGHWVDLGVVALVWFAVPAQAEDFAFDAGLGPECVEGTTVRVPL